MNLYYVILLLYLVDEPVHKWLATSNNIGLPEEFVSDCTQFYERVLSQNLSLMAIDQLTNQVNYIFGPCSQYPIKFSRFLHMNTLLQIKITAYRLLEFG